MVYFVFQLRIHKIDEEMSAIDLLASVCETTSSNASVGSNSYNDDQCSSKRSDDGSDCGKSDLGATHYENTLDDSSNGERKIKEENKLQSTVKSLASSGNNFQITGGNNMNKVSNRSSAHSSWTAEEDAKLREAVNLYGGRNWKKIADLIANRTDVQCLHRWQKVLRPGLIKGPWTPEVT